MIIFVGVQQIYILVKKNKLIIRYQEEGLSVG